jgi:hypothetical protein
MSATPFAARLVAVMVAVVLAASALTVALDYLKFRRILRAQDDVVYLFVANELASTIEDGMNLGLPLAALQTTEELLQRRRAAEPGTIGISVFDSTGIVRFDTEPFRVGSRLAAEWSAPRPDAAEWRVELDDSYLVGARIINNFGQTAGGVAVRYDPKPLEARMNAILLGMMRTAALMMALVFSAAIVAAIVLTRRYNAWFQRATALIDATAPGAAPYRGPDVGGAEAMMASVAETTRLLDDAEAALLRLGTGETETRPHAA